MARTPSTMMPLGTVAPEFSLLDTVSEEVRTLGDLRGTKATLVMFICNHCPYVKHIESGLCKFGEDYVLPDVGIVAISSNDVDNYPQDGPDMMKIFAAENSFNFPYLYDETQDIAKRYDAACTPDFFLFDKSLLCVYRGRFDSSRPRSSDPVTGDDLRNAVQALLQGKDVDQDQIPSVGCNIKWRD